MANRTVFGLAASMGVLSFLVSHYDQYFFTLHFLEALIYLVILLLMFYRLEEWAYVIGIASPVFWILLAGLGGVFGENLGEFARAMTGGESPVRFIGGVMFFVSLGLLVASTRAFFRTVWGTPPAKRILLVGFALVAGFYGSLVYALYQMSAVSGG